MQTVLTQDAHVKLRNGVVAESVGQLATVRLDKVIIS